MSIEHINNLGEQIRTLRQNSNMPLRKLASILDLDQSTLSKIEGNERKASPQTIKKIAQIFGVNKESMYTSFYSDIIVDLIGNMHNYAKRLKTNISLSHKVWKMK